MKNGRFTRYPKTTISLILLISFFLLDLTLGYIFCPKVVGTPDAYYHHDLPKYIEGIKSWGGWDYRVFTNSLGFIDRERREVPRVGDRPRVLFLGDSFTEGVGYEFDETFVGRFAQKASREGYEVLNAAVTSYSPRLYYLKTRYLLRNVGLSFNELIIGIDISDIQDELLHAEFTPLNDFGVSRYYLLNRVDSVLKQTSLTYYAIRSLSGQSSPPAAAYNFPSVDMDELLMHWDRDRGRWTLDDDIYRRWGERGLTLAAENMKLLAELCAEHGVKMTIFVYPWPQQVAKRDVDSIQVRFWREFCERYKIGFINLFPDFINDGPTEQILNKYFIPGDVHWNAAAHQLVADRIYEQWRGKIR